METPVVLIIYNRPQPTQQVVEAIRQARPKRLFVIADGPKANKPGDAEKCAAARRLALNPDWPCECISDCSPVNLGCRERVAGGLDWVFSQVEEAIILEDDCVPSRSFFPFCETLLERYRHDKRIMAISGDNFQPQPRTPYSYYFSRYPHVWGWASWRRAWALNDVRMSGWPEFKQSGMLAGVFEDFLERDFWTNMLDMAYRGAIDTWDFAWHFSCWRENGLAILPEVNLVTNIGFGGDATHTKTANALANLPGGQIDCVVHPPWVVRHAQADSYTFSHVFSKRPLLEFTRRRLRYCASRMPRPIKRLLRTATLNRIP